MAGPPGYKRGSWGGSLSLTNPDKTPFPTPIDEADRYESIFGTVKAIAELEHAAGHKRYTHHNLRLAAAILLARWRQGQVVT